MFRAFEKRLRLEGNDIPRRRRHQFIPLITGAASRLEDRALLSGAGGSAHAVADLAATPAGRHVTRMYEHVFGSAPTQQQVAQFVHEIRHGVSLTAIHKQLVAEVRAEERAAATPGASVVTMPSAGATARSSRLVENRGLGAMRGLNMAAPNLRASSPSGNALSTGIVTRTIAITNPTTTTTAGPVALNPALLANNGGRNSLSVLNTGRSNIPATIGTTNSTTGTAATTTTTATTGTTGTTATTTGSPLTALLGTTSVPTPGLTTGVTGATVGTSPTASITFNPATFANSPINASPVPANGALPFTTTGVMGATVGTSPTASITFNPATFANSPINASPVPANGALPFTGTPVNPSPVPVNGALPLTTV